MDYSYRFLQGREGVSGHARCGEAGQQLWARGLERGMECRLYQWKAGNGICIAAEKADESGQVHFFELPDGPLFLAAEGRLVLWETDAPEENYWRAWEFLRRTKEEKRKENGAFPTKEAPAEKTEEQTAKAAEAENLLIEETLEIPVLSHAHLFPVLYKRILTRESLVTLIELRIVAIAATISINIANHILQYPIILRKIKNAFTIKAKSALKLQISRIRLQICTANGRFARYSGKTITSAYFPLLLTLISISAAL